MDWTIIGLLVTFMAGVLVTVFVVGLLAATGKDTPTPFTEEAIRLVAQEQYDAGKESGRAESMRRRVGRETHQVAMQQAREAS